MHEQMKAERTRRAVVTEAEGAREAAITRAEGDKASAILTAEGNRQKDILNAEGEAQAVRTRAEAEQYRQEVVAAGEANAINAVYGAIINSGTDDRVIAIKYLESLAKIANGQATKIFVPADMSATLGSIGGIAEMLKSGGDNDGFRSPAAAAEAEVAARRSEPQHVRKAVAPAPAKPRPPMPPTQ